MLIEVRGCFWHQHGWEWDGRKLVQTSICPTVTRPWQSISRLQPFPSAKRARQAESNAPPYIGLVLVRSAKATYLIHLLYAMPVVPSKYGSGEPYST